MMMYVIKGRFIVNEQSEFTLIFLEECYMSKVAIVTDSNSGTTQKEAKELGISVLPMPFFINGDLLFEDIDILLLPILLHSIQIQS